MLLLLKLLVWAVRARASSRQALVLDNLALRHQLASVTHSGRTSLPRLQDIAKLSPILCRAL